MQLCSLQSRQSLHFGLEEFLEEAPLTIAPDRPVLQAIALMDQTQSSCVLVVEASTLVGLLTVTDVLRFMTSGIELSSVSIADVMTQPVITFIPSRSQNLVAALSLMRRYQIDTLPVVDEQHRLIGLVTLEGIYQRFQLLEMVCCNAELPQPPEEQTNELARNPAEASLLLQSQRERLITEIAQRIRQSLDLDQILSTTAAEVRQFLQVDRVIVFRFEPNWNGKVIVESVASGAMSLLSVVIHDPCFAENYVTSFKQGLSTAHADIYTAGLSPCYIELLAQFQVRANLAVPILQHETLWGLLIAHHCSAPRQWQPLEIDLLKQLAAQVAIAIYQSELHQQAQRELWEHKQTQAALQTSEERLRLALEAAHMGTWDWHITTNSLLWSKDVGPLLGLPSNSCPPTMEAAIGFIHPEDRKAVIRRAARAIQDGISYEDEFRVVGFEQTVRWVGCRGQVYRNQTGQPIRMLGSVTDITERKQTEQKLHEQSALIDITTDAILVGGLDHQIRFWNRGAERLYGWTAAEAIGACANQLLYKQITPQIRAALNAVLDKGEWQGELNKVTKFGEEIITASRWTLMRDRTGKPEAILSVDTDITEKKHLEAQFLQAQRLESLGTLASGITHDLNNVLTPILATTQLLLLKSLQLDEQSQQLLKLQEISAKRGIELVRQILAFTRGVEGKRSTLQISHLLLEVVKIARSTFPKSIEIAANVPTQALGAVFADATQLHQVFMNLCINARDAMPDGGTLTITAEDFAVDESYARMNLEAQVGAYVMVTIADTGIGISPEIVERIFEPFFTTKEMGKGTGLGLSTAIGIVKSHSGFITVDSQGGKGTQFKVFLPKISGTASQPPEILEPRKGRGELILVVDDEALVQEITKTSLETYNYRVLTATDAIEAIALYAEHKHNIRAVLIDMLLSSLDWVTTVRTLQRISYQEKIIVTSGQIGDAKLAETAGENIKAFLPKPYTVKELLDTLHRVISE